MAARLSFVSEGSPLRTIGKASSSERPSRWSSRSTRMPALPIRFASAEASHRPQFRIRWSLKRFWIVTPR